MVRIVFLNSLVLAVCLSISAADTHKHKKDTVEKVPYYVVELKHFGFIGNKKILVPKKHFDEQVQYYYLAEYQRIIFGYEILTFGFDLVEVGFNVEPDKIYEPGANKKKITVDTFVYTPSAIKLDKETLKNKHAALKFLQEEASKKSAEMIQKGYLHKAASPNPEISSIETTCTFGDQ